MNRAKVLVGLHAAGEGRIGWEQILIQEGLPYLEAEEPVSEFGLFSEHLPDWFECWVSRGGIAVVIGANDAMGLFPPSVAALIHRFRPPGDDRFAYAPDLASLFTGEGHGECRLHEDRKVKGGNDPDVFPLVFEQPLGEGTIIFTGVHLTSLLVAAGDCLRRFSPFTDVDERVASIDKAEVADTLVWMLRRAFRAWGVPYIRPVRFPEGAASAFILRVDVDGLFGDRTRRLAEVASAHNIPISFYFNGELCDHIPGELADWTRDHEIGQHCYKHNVFDTMDENLQNLLEGAEWVRERLEVEPKGFVAPRGLWNCSLEEALVNMRYTFSSDFSLAFDLLPYRTRQGILQIPVHPFSPERAVVFAEERGLARPPASAIAAYYRTILLDQVQRNRLAHFYGHPEVLGAIAKEVLVPLFKEVAVTELPVMTISGMVSWWERREETRFSAEYYPEKRHLSVRITEGSVPLEVFPIDGLTVDDGTDKFGVPDRSHFLIGAAR